MRRFLSILLCCALLAGLLSGCNASDEPYIPTGDGLTWDEDYTGPAVTHPQEEEVQELTLIYYPDITMNPYQCTDFTNRALFSLIYQGLFTVDREYNVEPMLCSSYSMAENMRSYTFYLDPYASFSDGTRVTSEDVVASLQAAKDTGYYRSRFSKVSSFGVSEDGGVEVKLNTAYENLPILLDIPIVKATEVELDRPLGSGPYVLSDYGLGAQLVRRTNWWCQADMVVTAPLISLMEAESINHIRDQFQFGDLDLVQADTGSDRYADYLCDYELWDSENGIFLYLVCNQESSIFSDADARAALTYAIDREFLVNEYYRGFARGATLPASPQSPYYNQALANQYSYDPAAFANAVLKERLDSREIVLLVNGKDSLRLRVAQSIVDMFAIGGMKVRLEACTDNTFSWALKNMEYDMYLGQTILSPNMDLSHFFSATGNLNYGNLSNMTAYTLCQQALENHGNFYTLHQTVMEEGLICPILFRSYAIYATRGLLTELTPARDNVFYYSIGKTMEQAYIRVQT